MRRKETHEKNIDNNMMNPTTNNNTTRQMVTRIIAAMYAEIKNHSIGDCPKKSSTPRSEWFVTKAMKKMQHLQCDEESDNEEEEEEQRG